MTVPHHFTIEIIKFLAKHERFTRSEITIGTGITRAAIERLVTKLHKAGAIHIDEWLDDSLGRQSIAVFTLGEGKDARKRTKMTGKAKTAAYNQRKKVLALSTLNAAMHRMAQPGESTCQPSRALPETASSGNSSTTKTAAMRWKGRSCVPLEAES